MTEPTTQALIELRRLAESVRDAELPHPKWLAENAFKAALNYGTVIELLDALEAQAREVERLQKLTQTLLNDCNAWAQEVKTEQRLSFRTERDTLRAELAAIRAQEKLNGVGGMEVKGGQVVDLEAWPDIKLPDGEYTLYTSSVVDVNAGLVEAISTGLARVFWGDLDIDKSLELRVRVYDDEQGEPFDKVVSLVAKEVAAALSRAQAAQPQQKEGV